jgi:hypothetical protein
VCCWPRNLAPGKPPARSVNNLPAGAAGGIMPRTDCMPKAKPFWLERAAAPVPPRPTARQCVRFRGALAPERVAISSPTKLTLPLGDQKVIVISLTVQVGEGSFPLLPCRSISIVPRLAEGAT